MDVRLARVTDDDWPLIERWLRAAHVRRYWGDPEENRRLLREAHGGAGHALIEADGRKVGLVVWQHPTRQELDAAGLDDIPTSVIDVDVMIGEAAATGRGVGPAAIRLVADAALADPAVPFVIAAAAVENDASRRAFAKAGFIDDRDFDDVSSGRCVLMVRRHGAAPWCGVMVRRHGAASGVTTGKRRARTRHSARSARDRWPRG